MTDDFTPLWPGGPVFCASRHFPLSTDSILLADFACVHRGERGIDLGCGAGILTLLLLHRQEGLTMTGLELLPEAAGLVVRGLQEENGPVQWQGPPEGPFLRQARGYRICDWLGGGLRVDTVYEPDGRIRCFLLTAGDGTQISFLAGRTS